MALHVTCPHCGKRLRAPDDRLQKKARCSGCQRSFRITQAVLSNPAVLPQGGASRRGRKAGAAPRRPSKAKSISEPSANPEGSAGPLQPAAEAAAAEWYLYAADERQYGPVARGELDRWFQEGRMNAECQIFRRGWASWKWADEVYPELAESEVGKLRASMPGAGSPPAPPPSEVEASAPVAAAGPTEVLSGLSAWNEIARGLRREVFYLRFASAAAAVASFGALGIGTAVVVLPGNMPASLRIPLGAALSAAGLLGIPLAVTLLAHAERQRQLTREAATVRWRVAVRSAGRLWAVTAATASALAVVMFVSAAVAVVWTWRG